MSLGLFFKIFILWLMVSLFAFGLTTMAVGEWIRVVAVGIAVSLAFAVFYPEVRGIRSGDRVSVIVNNSLPFFGRLGRALSEARKNDQLRIRLENGDEATGIVESYEGVLSLPRVRLLYEEKPLE